MIDELSKLDSLKVTSYKSRPFYIHNDHRFILPLVYEAQKNGLLPKPCKLITYDYHDDMHEISEDTLAEIVKLCGANKFDEDKFFDIIKNKLDPRDCDWIKAGMEFGMFSDAVLFGVHEIDDEYRDNYDDYITYKDRNGSEHYIYINLRFPSDLLAYQGELSDNCRNKDPSTIKLRKILDWDTSKHPFCFKKDCENIVLNFDLDAFTMHHDGYVIPWIPDIWEDSFIDTSDYYTTQGWSSSSFTRLLAEKSGIIVVTREPSWCTGTLHREKGDENADQILNDLNHYVFDDGVSIDSA